MSLAVPASFSCLPSTKASTFEPNGTINGRYWVRPAHVESKRSEPHVPLAATFAAPVVVNGSIEDDYEKLTKDLGKTSTLEITTKAHEKLGDNIIALAFSGAEDVTWMESWLTGCRLSVFIDALKEVRAMEGSSDGFLIMISKAKFYQSSCTELGLLSSSNMLLLQQCAW
ncbi:5'-adenylylsulfate reductase 2, chloroplastic-like isoform X1 [Corylus avellana]|uniref:5'-adenylylsulfate reductase 2, chloroplastic-like isoform X1 n=1 Tax=Corylus avellana TaxID=13451 RepID=UPI00286A71D4|nr:5'-adenylylsulfate reductase 2, chloroplastic-like isoform X1 [Corylus avellana]